MRSLRLAAWAALATAVGVAGGASAADEPAAPPADPPAAAKPPAGAENALFPDADRLPLRASFADGVAFSTPNEDFVLRLRVMAQADGKAFAPGDQDPARSGAYFPRVRTYFEGRATRSFDYEVSTQRSVEGTFDVLDANVNYHPRDEFQVKVGRFLVPFSYDYYDHLEQFFITPERGLFPLNFGLSREAGAMVWGKVGEGVADYAVGGFSGQLAGLADTNQTRDAVGYLNVRPFRHGGSDALRYVNVGGSAAYGQQAYPAAPLPLRTAVQSSENDEAANGASAAFLTFLPGVVQSGGRRQEAVHFAWYVRGLSVEAEAQDGKFDYRTPDARRVELPVQGFHVTASYFVTGEEVTGRTVVVPLRPFDPAGSGWGPGAVEPFARVSRLRLGGDVFGGGLADAGDSTAGVTTTDVGWNWYPNRYLKFYFTWQHSRFGSPVLLNDQTGHHRRADDLLWARAQLSF